MRLLTSLCALFKHKYKMIPLLVPLLWACVCDLKENIAFQGIPPSNRQKEKRRESVPQGQGYNREGETKRSETQSLRFCLLRFLVETHPLLLQV